MLDIIFNVRGEILKALGETAFMVIISLAAAIIFGGLLGLLLFATSDPLFIKNKAVNKITGVILTLYSPCRSLYL